MIKQDARYNSINIKHGRLRNKRKKDKKFKIRPKIDYHKTDQLKTSEKNNLIKNCNDSMQFRNITIDQNAIIMLIKFFIDEGVLDKDTLKTKQLPDNHPLKDIKINLTDALTKEQLRTLWFYQMRQDKLFCEICGQKITHASRKSGLQLTAEHRLPRCRGGATNSFNLLPAHSKCNTIKADIDPTIWEIIGPQVLKEYNIQIDFDRAMFNYQKTR